MFMHKNADNIMIWKGEQYEKNYYDQPRIWCRRRDFNPHAEALAPKTNVSAIPPRPQ